MKSCVLGLGTIGRQLASELSVDGHSVAGYDPRGGEAMPGVQRFRHPAVAAAGAEVVFGATQSDKARLCFLQVIEVLQPGAIYVDLSPASPTVKKDLASIAAIAQVSYVDFALLETPTESVLSARALLSGSGTKHLQEVFEPKHEFVILDAEAGVASARRFVRVLARAGLVGVVGETFDAAESWGVANWVTEDIQAEFGKVAQLDMDSLLEDTDSELGLVVDEVLDAKSYLDDIETHASVTGGVIERIKRRGSLSRQLDMNRIAPDQGPIRTDTIVLRH